MKLQFSGRWPLAVVAWVALLEATLALAPCSSPTPVPPPAPGSWLVLLCKAADAPQEPNPKSFYEELFSKDQRDLLFDYFDAVSDHTLDVSGTQVYGWFRMIVNTADIAPAVRNNTTQVKRDETARDCTASALGGIMASGIRVDPANYAGVITVINVPVDAGDTGEKSVVLADPAMDVGFIGHEMLHVLGLDHSYTMSPDASADHVWKHGGDVEYQDCWDMMSYRTCVYAFQTSRGPQGPELQAAYRDKLKWVPAGRVWTRGFTGPSQNTITLAPVSDPSKPGYLLARIELPAGWYVVEYREKTRFDRAIPSGAVVVREQRFGSGKTFLVKRQGGGLGWGKGETFTDAGNWISVSVDDIVSGAATITVNTAYSAAPGQLGDLCGDKFRGEVIACAAGLRCDARRDPPLVSIDYYCQQ
jgi:hypothetical protein